VAANEYDAIVVGGGHNGLIAAAYMAKHGSKVVVVEGRHKTGGATDTMSPWPEAPEFKVTTLSYVMSLMPPEIQKDIELHRFGYKIYPQGMGYLPLPDGRSIINDGGPKELETISQFSKKDAETLPKYYEWIGNIADLMHPMLMEIPPKLGSLQAGDLIDQLRFVMKRRDGMNVRTMADITKLFTMSAADLLREWFESPELIGLQAVNGIIGTWAGPEEPGTAYVLMHHSVGVAEEGEGVSSWGYPEGGMGAVADACRRSAEHFGAEIRVNAPVERILTRAGKTYGVALKGGEEIHAPVVVTTVHPKIAFERLLDPAGLPDDFVRDIANWRSRSGVVKINVALDALPTFKANPEFDPDVHGGAIEILEDLEYLETAYQEARLGKASTKPFSDTAIPTVFDKTLAPEGKHIMSMYTQWAPATWADEDHMDELEKYADRMFDRVEAVAPGFKNLVLHRQIIGPREMQQEWNLIGGNIFHGELTVNQLFHMRPSAGWADYRTPIRGLYQAGSATHAGGGVTGMPAHHAFKVMLKDRVLGRNK
jgi:phytoene dehydrogenase-like protein